MVEQVQLAEARTGGTPVRDVDYTYDPLNRLLSETVVGATSTTYTYDDLGNRLAKDICSGDPLVCDTTTYAYNANNQLLTEDGPEDATSYFYDTNGSLAEKDVGADVTTYAYDARNRMVGAETPDDVLEFAYDDSGIRVQKVVDGAETNYLIDKVQPYAQVVEERNASGVLIASYTYGNDLISQQRGSDVSYYHYDGLGSTGALTDATGTVTDTYAYEAFGSIYSSTGTTSNAYLFTGEQWDAETGLEYLRARYYDPAVGRFVSRDKWKGNSELPISLNKYLYTNASPIINYDPTGRLTIIGIMSYIPILDILSCVAMPSHSQGGGLRASLAQKLAESAYADVSVDIQSLEAGIWIPDPMTFDFFQEKMGWDAEYEVVQALREIAIKQLMQSVSSNDVDIWTRTDFKEIAGSGEFVGYNTSDGHIHLLDFVVTTTSYSFLKNLIVHELGHGSASAEDIHEFKGADGKTRDHGLAFWLPGGARGLIDDGPFWY